MALRKNIKVKLHGNSIIRISYEGEDPTESMNIVRTIADIFIAENLKQQNSETENAIAFINDQLALYQKKLKQSEISQMEDQLNNLLIDSTPKHPMVVSLRKRIDSAKAEMTAGDYTVKDEAVEEQSAEIDELKEELKSIRKELSTSSLAAGQGGENRSKIAATTNDKLYKLLLLERVEKVRTKDTGVNEGLYNELLKRLETAKITQRLEASNDGTRYIILDPARMPLKPIKPNKPLVMFAGLFIGICLGMGCVMIAEVFDHSFLGVEEVKDYFEMPMLGAISRIITQADIREQKMRRLKLTSLFVVLSIVLAVSVIYSLVTG